MLPDMNGGTLTRTAALALALSACTGSASAQSTTSLAGDGTYRLYCATCHGPKGRGDGPLAASLKRPPTDLTTLAQANKGPFPAELVATVIDGRKPAKGHGGGDMPVWGDAFTRSDERTPVAERIGRVVKYLESIQVRP